MGLLETYEFPSLGSNAVPVQDSVPVDFFFVYLVNIERGLGAISTPSILPFLHFYVGVKHARRLSKGNFGNSWSWGLDPSRARAAFS